MTTTPIPPDELEMFKSLALELEQKQTATQGTHSDWLDYELLHVFCKRVESGEDVDRQTFERIAKAIRKVLDFGDWGYMGAEFQLPTQQPMFKTRAQKQALEIWAYVNREIVSGTPVGDAKKKAEAKFRASKETIDTHYYHFNKMMPRERLYPNSDFAQKPARKKRSDVGKKRK